MFDPDSSTAKPSPPPTMNELAVDVNVSAKFSGSKVIFGSIADVPPLTCSSISATPRSNSPTMPAAPAFSDDAASTDALTVPAGAYKVVFLAFPFEAYGTASDKADRMHRVLSYLG